MQKGSLGLPSTLCINFIFCCCFLLVGRFDWYFSKKVRSLLTLTPGIFDDKTISITYIAGTKITRHKATKTPQKSSFSCSLERRCQINHFLHRRSLNHSQHFSTASITTISSQKVKTPVQLPRHQIRHYQNTRMATIHQTRIKSTFLH